jgi:hypothetical protein
MKDEAGVRVPFNIIVHTQFRENLSRSAKGEFGKYAGWGGTHTHTLHGASKLCLLFYEVKQAKKRSTVK